MFTTFERDVLIFSFLSSPRIRVYLRGRARATVLLPHRHRLTCGNLGLAQPTEPTVGMSRS
jgi:hypothetical protein